MSTASPARHIADRIEPSHQVDNHSVAPAAKNLERGEVLPLTSIRGIAALWVVAVHMLTNLEQHGHMLDRTSWAYDLIQAGQIGVDIFFVLSGFIMSASYGTLKPSGIPGFLYFRAVRIFPLHLAVLTAMAIGVAFLAQHGISAGDPAYFAMSTLPYHYSLTFAILGMSPGWNLPTWSLCIELLAYLAFPVALIIIRWLPRPARAGVAIAAVLVAVHTLDTLGFSVTGHGAIARGLCGFLTGMLMQSLFPAGFRFTGTATVCMAAVLCLGLAGDEAIHLAPIAIAVLIPALAGPRLDITGRLFSSRPAVWLGHISFSLYLLQVPMLIVWLRLPIVNEPGPAHVCAFVATFLAALLTVSHFIHQLLEEKARKGLRRLWPRSWATSL